MTRVEIEDVGHQLVLGLLEDAFLGSLLEQYLDLFNGDGRRLDLADAQQAENRLG
jgi:hypothetical protein